MIAVIFEKGAVDSIEDAREAVSSAGIIEINKGFRFDIQNRNSGQRLHAIIERGAVDSIRVLESELRKPVAMIEINKGFRFDLMEDPLL